jgi:hypothetical protein
VPTLHRVVPNRRARLLANCRPVPQAIAYSCILARHITRVGTKIEVSLLGVAGAAADDRMINHVDLENLGSFCQSAMTEPASRKRNDFPGIGMAIFRNTNSPWRKRYPSSNPTHARRGSVDVVYLFGNAMLTFTRVGGLGRRSRIARAQLCHLRRPLALYMLNAHSAKSHVGYISMPNKIVLLPFAESLSFDHLVSTLGGNTVPGAENTVIIYEKAYKNELDTVRKLTYKRLGVSENTDASTLISALKKHTDPAARQIGAHLEGYRNDYIEAIKQKDEAITRGWQNIDRENVVCADSKNLVAALRKLQAEDDTLIIRGHCGKGMAILMSASKTATITVIELINILRGRLNKKFSGKIVIFGCESAKDTAFSESFASRFANEMFEQGWINCRYFGYNEKLKTVVNSDTGRRVTTAGNKAKMAKVEITPDILPCLAHTFLRHHQRSLQA